MTDTATGAGRTGARLSALLLAILTLVPVPAAAWPEDRGIAAHRARRHRQARPPAPPPYPQAAIVSAYLPRNHNVPMYNEPPPRGPAW